MGLTGFWAAIDAQLEQVRNASTVDKVLAACPPIADMSVGDGFFEGSGGDDSIMDALHTAGWTFPHIEASYYYVARDPQGDCLTYVEGDIYRGDTLPRR